ncbi:hypothetical protein RhiirA5_393633 [Rhizophagus irregularis]|uniref:Uncharacterized protein n=3 Tax=Rhizophagus irregularis TaxID=588596 RepID=A0A2I1EW42_9GLOM|nr:hypothetical protein GLOIN_2v1561570 [Rhizophagus irregularis DAOM 181602=DAOM 197198]PKC17570.1 hypothetical protein RhiirA5_393633 [Rhizophagus irregularis]PKK76445.1 hypothetical protein RhiirC2_862600 [Rhizophagus irregularis]PKY26348.1 hypothetical protein RhiirB3_528523 [Rhizophagus irregularis]PKY46042.1 hypothetical protein RhiirA4_444102 [Rhizophagus irregularis]POG75903.1 hypothetical protein GLOIN_2v1561570 [Rhizophagus irregularis DAOM 181602=DAOM 197198]|eukprot:XP_025182769.1 hypothetical protein GLOIN_2v1561570 [Rhizophagus irregularis DAOM 181602=DAOM 197198]
MNYPPGKIILLDEFEDNPEKWIGDYFRVVGKLIYHNMSKNLAVIEQNVKYTTDKGKQHEGQPHDNVRIRKCFLIVDTKLVEDEPYIEGKTVEFLGLLINDNIYDSKFYQLPQKIKEMITADIQRTRFPLLEARIFRTVDFMDMDFYQYVVNIRNKYEQE